MFRTLRWKQAAGAAVGVSALAFTVACNGTSASQGVAAQALSPPQAGTPVVVGCEPHQRTLVRPAVVNGVAVSQIDCVAAAAADVATPRLTSAPAAYASPHAVAPSPVRRVSQPVYSDLPDAQVVPASSDPGTVRTRQVVYERPAKRSVTKSAVIIGSSAGVGAGVGAAMGGKKGALIGAAIGGGGAAIWDQVTRRK